MGASIFAYATRTVVANSSAVMITEFYSGEKASFGPYPNFANMLPFAIDCGRAAVMFPIWYLKCFLNSSTLHRELDFGQIATVTILTMTAPSELYRFDFVR